MSQNLVAQNYLKLNFSLHTKGSTFDFEFELSGKVIIALLIALIRITSWAIN